MASQRLVDDARAARAEFGDRISGVRSLVDEARALYRAAYGLPPESDLEADLVTRINAVELDLEHAAQRFDALLSAIENVPTPKPAPEPQEA